MFQLLKFYFKISSDKNSNEENYTFNNSGKNLL